MSLLMNHYLQLLHTNKSPKHAQAHTHTHKHLERSGLGAVAKREYVVCLSVCRLLPLLRRCRSHRVELSGRAKYEKKKRVVERSGYEIKL